MDRAADTWTLSRVIAAGEALARVDGERAQTGAGKGASEGVKGRGFALVPGPLVGLVTNREPTRAVHCKGSGETVPCTRLILADDTRNDVHAVLWRTHAGLDVGARSSQPFASVDSGHPSSSNRLPPSRSVMPQAPETWWRSNPSA